MTRGQTAGRSKGTNGISHEVMIGFSYAMDQTKAWFWDPMTP